MPFCFLIFLMILAKSIMKAWYWQSKVDEVFQVDGGWGHISSDWRFLPYLSPSCGKALVLFSDQTPSINKFWAGEYTVRLDNYHLRKIFLLGFPFLPFFIVIKNMSFFVWAPPNSLRTASERLLSALLNKEVKVVSQEAILASVGDRPTSGQSRARFLLINSLQFPRTAILRSRNLKDWRATTGRIASIYLRQKCTPHPRGLDRNGSLLEDWVPAILHLRNAGFRVVLLGDYKSKLAKQLSALQQVLKSNSLIVPSGNMRKTWTLRAAQESELFFAECGGGSYLAPLLGRRTFVVNSFPALGAPCKPTYVLKSIFDNLGQKFLTWPQISTQLAYGEGETFFGLNGNRSRVDHLFAFPHNDEQILAIVRAAVDWGDDEKFATEIGTQGLIAVSQNELASTNFGVDMATQ
jgi:hypothetical protein